MGWSTQVPLYNPLEVIDNVSRRIQNLPLTPMRPYYVGFRGSIDDTHTNSHDDVISAYHSSGVVRKLNATTLEITELPVKKWTNDYKVRREQEKAETQKERERVGEEKRREGEEPVRDKVRLVETESGMEEKK